MKLLCDLAKLGIPNLYAQEDAPDPTVYAILARPDLDWRWYVSGLDVENHHGFGLVQGFEREKGYFCVAELNSCGVQLIAAPKLRLSQVEVIMTAIQHGDCATYLTTAPPSYDLNDTHTLWSVTDAGVTTRCVVVQPQDIWQQLGRYTVSGHIPELVPQWVNAA